MTSEIYENILRGVGFDPGTFRLQIQCSASSDDFADHRSMRNCTVEHFNTIRRPTKIVKTTLCLLIINPKHFQEGVSLPPRLRFFPCQCLQYGFARSTCFRKVMCALLQSLLYVLLNEVFCRDIPAIVSEIH